jgi:hypothetical protein
MRPFRFFAVMAVLGVLPLVALSACGEDDEETRFVTSNDAGIDRIKATPALGAAPDAPAPLPAPIADAACTVVVEEPSQIPANHLPVGTEIAYSSNPPSSGPHYPSWAHFQEYAAPVPDGYLVHALEHGAVLLLYKCDALDASSGECANVIASLRAVRDALAADPSCDPSVRVRVILAPRPALDVPVAAAAWGFTYKAACVDPPSLTQFVTEHYAKAPENFCAPGITTF